MFTPAAPRRAESLRAMTHDVFISHAVEDKQVADEVCRALEDEGLRCWVAPRDIPPGRDYEEAIVEGIAASRVLLLILSKHSNNSPHVRREVQHAFTEGSSTRVIPFRIESVPYNKSLSYYLGSAQWIDASAPPLESHIQRLVELVRPGPSDAPVPEASSFPRGLPTERGGRGASPFPQPPEYESRPRPRTALWVAGIAAALIVTVAVAFLVYRASVRGRDNRNALDANVNAATPPANVNSATPTPTTQPPPSPATTRPPIRNLNLRIPANLRAINANTARRRPQNQ